RGRAGANAGQVEDGKQRQRRRLNVGHRCTPDERVSVDPRAAGAAAKDADRKTAAGVPRRFLLLADLSYGKTISTRRFCGSRTPGAVGTRLSFSPRPDTAIC